MKAIDLTETYLQKKCSQSLPLNFKRVPFYFFFFKRIDLLIIGDIRKIQHLFFSLFFKKVIVVDDGMVTLSIINSDNQFKWVSNNLKRNMLHFFFKIFNKKISYYTLFIDSYIYNKSINIEFFSNRLKEKKIKSKLNPGTLVIGMDLVELNILNKSYYIELLKKIINKYKKIYYYPHRNEKITYCIDGLNYIERNKNLEAYVIENTRYSKIISFYSTSIFLLKKLKISDVDLSYIELNKDEIKLHQNIILNTYKFLKLNGIKKNKLSID